MNNITKPVALQIEEAVKDIPGWSPIDQLLCLFTLAISSACLQGDILELGSWCGRSAVVLGMAARLTGNTKVHCVDLFPEKKDWYQNDDGTYSFNVSVDSRQVGAYVDQRVWHEPFSRDIEPVYDKFLGTREAFDSAILTNGLTNWVKPFKGDLLSFSQKQEIPIKLRMAFIDGDHSYAAVTEDISLVERYLIPGGWICFDDAFSCYSGVNDAIKTHIIDSGRYFRCQQLTRKLFVAQLNKSYRI